MRKLQDVVAAVRQEFVTSLAAAAEAVDGRHAAACVPLERTLDAVVDIGPYATEPYLRGSTMHVRIWRGGVAGCDRTVVALTPAYRHGWRSHASAFDWDAVVATAMACRLSPAELRRTFLVTDRREGGWNLITFVPAPRLPLSARIRIRRAGQRHTLVPLKHRLTPMPADTLHALVGESVETYPERTRTADTVAAYAARRQTVTIAWDPRDLAPVRDAAHHFFGLEEALRDRGWPEDAAAAHRLSAVAAIGLGIHHAYRGDDSTAHATDAVVLQRPRLTTSEIEAFETRAEWDGPCRARVLRDLRHVHHLVATADTRLAADQRCAAGTALAHLAQRLIPFLDDDHRRLGGWPLSIRITPGSDAEAYLAALTPARRRRPRPGRAARRRPPRRRTHRLRPRSGRPPRRPHRRPHPPRRHLTHHPGAPQPAGPRPRFPPHPQRTARPRPPHTRVTPSREESLSKQAARL
ncbi:hypothetical protein AB0H73_35060 [Streptomyces olivoreticuli]